MLLGDIAVLLVIFAGWTAYSDEGGVVQIYKKATVPFDDEKKVDSVLSLPEKTILVQTPYQGGLFWTETRKDKMERYRCNDCHNNKYVAVSQAAEITHGDIVLDHGGQEKPLSCFTCHKEDERDFLTTEKGVQIDMDHSYQMCGQCHFRQKKIGWVVPTVNASLTGPANGWSKTVSPVTIPIRRFLKSDGPKFIQVRL